MICPSVRRSHTDVDQLVLPTIRALAHENGTVVGEHWSARRRPVAATEWQPDHYEVANPDLYGGVAKKTG